jgi:hypothetical protein
LDFVVRIAQSLTFAPPLVNKTNFANMTIKLKRHTANAKTTNHVIGRK